jgi:hypothetical protein
MCTEEKLNKRIDHINSLAHFMTHTLTIQNVDGSFNVQSCLIHFRVFLYVRSSIQGTSLVYTLVC